MNTEHSQEQYNTVDSSAVVSCVDASCSAANALAARSLIVASCQEASLVSEGKLSKAVTFEGSPAETAFASAASD